VIFTKTEKYKKWKI